MIAVFYDPETGRITHTMSGHPAHFEDQKQGEHFIEVDEFRQDWDVTHKVIDGKVVERDQDELDAERRQWAAQSLRAARDQKLLHEVDPLVCNPMRWAALTLEQKTAVAAYRNALLDLTHTTPDPLTPVWPQKPDCMR